MARKLNKILRGRLGLGPRITSGNWGEGLRHSWCGFHAVKTVISSGDAIHFAREQVLFMLISDNSFSFY